MVSSLPHLLPLRGKGLGPPCCSTWLAALVLPGFSSLLFRFVQTAALIALWSLGVVSYNVGLATVGQGWFPSTQWECSVVLGLQGIGLLWCLWPFAEGVSPL